jgi:predicted AAA+ superfamily ATPase
MIKRLILAKINESWSRGKSILLLGPRQTGKTTLTKNFEFDLTINFLSAKVRQSYEQNPDLILKEVNAAKKIKKSIVRVLVDEVQKVPAIMDPIQFLIDEKKAQFFITGSSARKLKQQADVNLLPGRVISFNLDAISLEEYLIDEIDEILDYGQLPEVILTKDVEQKEELLQTYVEVYLEEEIRKEAQLRKLPDFYHFLERAAEHAGLLCSHSSIAQDVGISHVTVKSYYEILETTLIAHRIEPIYQSNKRKKLIRSPKYLFFDLGVRRLAAKQGANQPNSVKGITFESFIGIEILKFIRIHKLKCNLSFWQDPGVADVDWVIKKEQKYFPFEIKLKNKIVKSDCKHLLSFIQEYPCPKGGFVIYTGKNPIQIDDQIMAYPWQELPKLLRDLKL